MKELPEISIIIPCRNEENYLADCLESVIGSGYPKEKMEILVYDGNSTDQTKQIASEYALKFPYIHVFENSHKTVPYAMNAGIKAAKGEYIVRLDAHSKYPVDYFEKLINWSVKLKADNVGAVWITDVKNKNRKTLSIRSVLTSTVGVGNAFFRTGISEVKEVDTVPFGCYHKSVFEKYGGYNNRLTRNQDIELNKRIKNNGGKIYLIPDINCTYFARETFKGIAHNNYRNGHWNVLTVYITKTFKSLSFRHFIPLALILSLIVPAILAIVWHPYFIGFSLAAMILYQAFIIIASLRLKSQENSFIYLWWCFIILHFSYGLGSLTGIFRFGKLIS